MAALVIVATLLSAAVALAVDQTHVVQPGETLFSIARRYGKTVEEIAFANGITNPALIYVGQVLVIPGTGGTGSPGGATGGTYTIKAGDTLFSLARRFGTTVDVLVRINNLSDPSRISVGQVLKLPGTSPAPTQPATTQAPTTATSPAPTGTPVPVPTTHTVRAGETLSQIALRYGMTYQELAILNNLSNPNLIYVGQVLIVRSSGGVPTPTQRATATGTATQRTPTAVPSKTATQAPPTATQTRVTNTPATQPSTTPGGEFPEGFQTPTPIAPAGGIPANAPNLLTNPGFEGAFREVAFNTVQVAEGWQPFYCDLPYTSEKCPALRQGSGNPVGLLMGRPEFSATASASRVSGGAQAQRWFCLWRSCRGGVFQTISTTPGVTCEAGAFVQSWSANTDGLTSTVTDNSIWFIRVDLSGGTNAFVSSTSMLLSRGFDFADGHYDRYTKISYTFKATGTQTTVFFENLRLWPIANNESFIDDAYVRCSQ